MENSAGVRPGGGGGREQGRLGMEMGLPFLNHLCAFLSLLEFPEGHRSAEHFHTALKITKVMDGPEQQGGQARPSPSTIPGLQINCVCLDWG